MLVERRLPRMLLLRLTFAVARIAGPWALFVAWAYHYLGLHFLRMPFLPIATIGTAVAFYVGFKNNASYDRFWEGRKIWGGIVNVSRAWSSAVLAYVEPNLHSEKAVETRRRLVYRQLAWINALRVQLRRNSRFMRADAHKSVRERLQNHEEHMRNDWSKEVSPFLSEQEFADVSRQLNPVTHIAHQQAVELATLNSSKRLDLFHQIALMDMLKELYTLQGQCERIKNTPFPRQYAEFSRWFVRAFLILLPLGLLEVFGDRMDTLPHALDEFRTHLEFATAVAPLVLASVLISWVFSTMEGVGDASEDPFERSINDVPMNALCRTIERDLRQLLGEEEIPDAEEPIGICIY